ncbi:exopolyphosphatase [Blastococcus sp. TBT05-19]|uniref:acyclic terpene utilization AtuA family protein n=1 Tax=Blastococcus sp. TBT05-19 TaxID=2250581 RepID=UPI000DE8A5F6|nr:acyclic terpene utilization AtuA family protein [Blastococcus sp. TBT05-19]RBY94627.1 exopolyphosphatase [Blastococcus sp. TBT05-19]
MSAPLRVANVSGFYGDRHSAMREMLEGGEVDVLTGDYLAELTMLILGRQKADDPTAGYARTFLSQLEECLGTALERGVRIVSNAGGLNPQGLAAAVTELGQRLGLAVRVATVSGDDLLPRVGDLTAGGLLRGGDRAPGDRDVTDALTANAYLGCRGIVRALEAGADVVVTGRVTDASLVVGPAAWHHGWGAGDLDALAGATVAGHVLECGAQATGGNFSFFAELLDADPAALDRIGFPLAEIAADGSSVITKHAGTGGAVTVETVTEQLLYELTGSSYGGPDVVTRFDTLRLRQAGPDRVEISGARGMPAGEHLKVAVNRLGGFRNSMTLPLTGLDVERKAELLQRQLAPALAGVEEVRVALARTDSPDAGVQEEAAALLHVTVKDRDRRKVGKGFTVPVIELGLASIPGFHATAAPPSPSPYGVYSAAWVPAAEVPQVVGLPDGTTETIPSSAPSGTSTPAPDPVEAPAWTDDGATRRMPLGRVAGARSGDKGGAATLGVYARSDEGYAWLAGFLTADRLCALLPEAARLPVTRELLPGLRALLFQLPGLLGDGVAAGTRFDPQAKAVGEWLRSRVVDVPVRLLPPEVGA